MSFIITLFVRDFFLSLFLSLSIYIYIYIYIWYAPVVAPDREFCKSQVRGKYKEPPHLLVVRAGNSFDLGPVWLRQEAERGAQWRRLRPDRGGDWAAAAAITGVL